MARRPLVMGNWKLNGSKAFTKELIEGLKAELQGVTGCDVAIAPPVMYLGTAETVLAGSQIALGAQNVDVNVKGAFTGDISTEMLKDFGAKYIIIGHSERRTYHKESDEFVAKKFGALKEAGLVPVLCIGETEAENEAGKTEEVCARQIDAVINALGVEAFNGAVIAYEPIWAIGTGKSATPAQAQAVHAFIRGHIAAKSQTVADQVIIQYGGSVNDANAAELFTQPDIDGALVGGASLKAPAFAVIVKAAAAAKKAQAAAASKNTGSSSSSAGSPVVSGNGTFTHPCPAGYISSTFGYRTQPIAGASTNHKGIDFAAATGTPIYAAAAGTVISAGYAGKAGNLLVVSHGNGLLTYYMHCNAIYVSAGQKVSRGQNVAAVGTTGNSTGPHLHFQVMLNGTPLNPANYL